MELYFKDISPPARAVYATIKHLSLPVSLKVVQKWPEDTKRESFLKINPSGKIPTLVDGDFVLGESRAIMAYLVNQYSPNHSIYPSDPRTRAQIDRMLYFEGTNLFPALRATIVPRMRHKTEPTEEAIQAAKNAIDELIALKGDNRFMTGSTATLADISLAMSYAIFVSFFPEQAQKLETWYKDVEVAIPKVKEVNDAVDWAPLQEMLKK